MSPMPGFYFPEEPSVLDPRTMVEWKRSRGGYSFSTLPTLCLVANPRFLPWSRPRFRAPLRGLPKGSFIRRDMLFLPYESNGGSHLVSLLEELRVLGVEEVLFLGLAGRLEEGIPQGALCPISIAGSGTGVSAYYHPEERVEPHPSRWAGICRTSLGLESYCCFSLDAPFRETASLIREWKAKGYGLVDMETAALYAFSQFHRMPVYSVLIG